MIPVNTPLLEGNEKKYLAECIDTGWISSEGPFVKKFEDSFINRLGRKHAIALSNGSAALEVAFTAIGIKSGDEVILPTFTIISCISPLIRIGAIPIFVDVDIQNWNMEVEKIKSKISSKTKAILVVHIYGLPVDLDPIIKLAKEKNLYIIEDAAEMIGQKYKGKECGTFGDISTFSFYPNKHITTGEGGMILTDDDYLASKSRELINLSFTPPRRFVHYELGWNYRITNMQAALGLAQFEQLDKNILKKRQIGAWYDKYLKGIIGVSLPIKETEYAKNIYWVYGILINKEHHLSAIDVMERLLKKGIGTRPFFYPLHIQPVFSEMNFYKDKSFPNSEYLSEKGFYLPSGLGVSEEEVKAVSIELKKIFNNE